MKWSDLCDDPSLRDIPAKIELNKDGQIVMSPTQNRHGFFAGWIAGTLRALMVDGQVSVELAVETEDSTKVTDVAWASPQRFSIIKDEASSSIAPEICVEIQSPGNSVLHLEEKRRLYLAAGAEECWICRLTGEVEFYNSAGRLDRSLLCPGFPSRIPI